ncbi:MAG: ShlB/FhaC/HecB family hemolysin secretion/activation protein [Candidatus Omnitrophica bacterium]|nr:ShlB/FhaC/HecB family hemolysin secretion/activation protein [Candidatus Omnitrophota bacterium]
MEKRKGCVFAGLVLLTISFIFLTDHSFVQAQTIPMGQDLGGQERARTQEKIKNAEEKKLGAKSQEAAIEEKGITPAAPDGQLPGVGTKVLIEKVEVTGVTAFKPAVVRSLVSFYEGKELSLADFSEITKKITDLYRTKGYVTTLAYLPPQKIENKTLKIEVLEGKVGKVNIEGNKCVSEKLICRYLDLTKEQVFNYDALRDNVNYMNQHPDRNASVVLSRGEEKGETDVNVNVKDRLPLHATLSYNNYNSRYLDYHKFITEIKATNLWGLDHQVSGEFQIGPYGEFYLWSGRYMAPLTPRDKVGAGYVHVDQELGGTLKNLEIKGRGDIISAFYSRKIYSSENFSLSLNPGFEVKEIENRILGSVLSEDNTRTAKIGFDVDLSDPLGGRNIVTQDFGWGIPGFMGGLDSKDPVEYRS